MTRIKASAIHLAISAAIAVVVVALLLGFWYPPPLFTSGGGMDLFFILLSVDVVLGPLLTLTVFRAGKRGLKFDLAVIAVLQIAALAYGLNIIAATRPAYIVAMPHRVVVVHANEMHMDPPPPEQYSRAPIDGPKMVTLRPPEDMEAYNALMMDVMSGQPEIEARPAFYVPLEEGFDELFSKPLSLEDLFAHNPGRRPSVEEWLKKSGVESVADVAYLPVMTRDREIALFLDVREKRLLGMLDIASDY